MTTTYDAMKTLIPKMACFEGWSVRAEENNNSYIVYSYKTQILRVDVSPVKHKIKRVVFNNTFYSRTTRKIQYIIKAFFLPNIPTEKITIKVWERETHYGKVLKEIK